MHGQRMIDIGKRRWVILDNAILEKIRMSSGRFLSREKKLPKSYKPYKVSHKS